MEHEFNFKNFSINDDNGLYNSNNGHNCEYYEPEQFIQKVQSLDSNNFSSISLNVRSLPGNWIEFRQFISSINNEHYKVSLICLQEIWSVPPFETFDFQGYKPFHFKTRDAGSQKRGNVGGGIGLWVDEDFEFEPIDSISTFIPHVFESQFIKIKTSRTKFQIYGNIYRPNTAPLGDMKQFNSILSNILNTIKSCPNLKNAESINLLGDFNINLLKHETHPDTCNYLATLLSNSLLPIITLPTRITPQNATLIDHICTNISSDTFDTGIVLLDISDHFMTFHIRSLNKSCKKSSARTGRKINDQTIDLFKCSLSSQNWENVISNSNPKEAFDNFFETLDICFDSSFPEVKPKASSRKYTPINPWMTTSLLNSRKFKEKLFSKKLKNPSHSNIEKFKQYNSIYTKLVRKARTMYYDNKFTEFSSDCKKTWSLINSVLGKGGKKVNIPEYFHSNGKVLEDCVEIAEGFNEFFSTIGSELASEIPVSKKHFSEYLSEESNENFIFANMTEEIIFNAAGKLKNKNSSGSDGISTNLLKSILPTIITPLCHVFNLSYKLGFIPTVLKTAKVVPIFKSGDKHLFTNYRPISLLTSFSKLLEKVAATQIMRYLNKFNLIYNHQYGFRKEHNISHPLLHFLDKIYDSFNKPTSEYNIAIFIDLKKAFDTCDPNILLKKLEYYGFRGMSNKWFENYLKGRYQYTCVNGAQSKLKEISCGVPQGSILGPILFLLLINDLPNASKILFTLLYADDTTLQNSSPNLNELILQTNEELEKISDWFKANKLTLNTAKTKYMVFNPKNDNRVNSNLTKLHIENVNIDRIGKDCESESFKFVGINIDENLKWDKHIEHIRNKLLSANYALSKTKNILPTKIKMKIYNSLFKSHLEFGMLSWGPFSEIEVHRLVQIQKKAVRNIAGVKSNSHTDPLFAELKILKAPDLLQMNMLSFMYKYDSKKVPPSFENHFTPLINYERSKNYHLINVKCKKLQKFPSYSLPKRWNELSLDEKRINSLSSFKKIFKLQVLSKYNQVCTAKSCFICKS